MYGNEQHGCQQDDSSHVVGYLSKQNKPLEINGFDDLVGTVGLEPTTSAM